MRITLLFSLVFCPVVVGVTPDASPVVRKTNDRDLDLFHHLLHREEYDQANQMILDALRASEPLSDDHARWTVRKSELDAAQRKSLDDFSDEQLRLAQHSITELLTDYPDHPRALFLQAQRITIASAAAEHDLLAVMVNPADSSRAERSLQRLTRVSDQLDLLAKQVSAEKTRLDMQSPNRRDDRRVQQFERLFQQLQVDQVATKVLTTELFPISSRDRLGAATAARQAADRALTVLPSDCQAGNEIRRLRIIASLRGDDLPEAQQQWEALAKEVSADSDDRIRALGIRIDLRQKKLDSAKQQLQSYYGTDAETRNASLEMDLVRLQYLLTQGDTPSENVAAWIDSIESRHGVYGRRRAETLTLAAMRSTGNTSEQIEPGLVAAQGRQYLRQGEPLRAAQLLSAASAAEQQAERATEFAIESAAAFVAADRKIDASKILAVTAISNPTATKAAAIHLLAAVLMSDEKATAAEIEPLLLRTIKLWPNSEQTTEARRWLVKLYEGQRRYVDAAAVSTQLLNEDSSEAEIASAVDFWKQALRQSDETLDSVATSAEVAAASMAAFEPLLDLPRIRRQYLLLAAYHFMIDKLRDIKAEEFLETLGEDRFSAALLRFRLDGREMTDLTDPPIDRREEATRVLMRDGRQFQSRQKQIASIIANWPGIETQTIDQAERLVWQGRIEDATELILNLHKNSPDGGNVLRRGAVILAASSNAEAKREALKLWDRLASGLRNDKRAWHQARLRALELLVELGENQQANQRARYAMLADAPEDAETKRQYQQFFVPVDR